MGKNEIIFRLPLDTNFLGHKFRRKKVYLTDLV